MKCTQMGAAALAPVNPFPDLVFIESLLSNPTQTEVEISFVKPLNHASLKPFVVPVFPAAGCWNPILRTIFPVPLSTTPRIISNNG